MLRVTESFFPASVQYYIYTNPLESPPSTKVKSNWLIYLLSVEPSPISGTWWKKEEVMESYCVVSGADRVPALAALHTFLLEMIFWHLFTDPLKTRLNLEKPFRHVMSMQWKREKGEQLKWNENKNSLLEQFSLRLLHIFKYVAPLKWPPSHLEYFQRDFAITAVKLRTVYSRK